MTTNYITLRNAASCREDSIPVLSCAEWRRSIVETCSGRGEGRVVALFGHRTSDSGVRLYSIVGIDSKGELRISATDLSGTSYPCLTLELAQAHLFEREIFEDLGVRPEGHPWLKPVRKSDGYNYFSVLGESIHEVAVGPVHAGVIEPGHFRFQCNGEKVFNLEIHLGYQRRGVEAMLRSEAPIKKMVLAESIAGDSVIAHGLAYCYVMEALGGREVTQRARVIRAIALELERIANHVGDLGAIANDVGYLPAASYFGRLRAEFLNMLMSLSGNRFGRGLLKLGGVAFDITQEMINEFRLRIESSMRDINDTANLMFSSPSVVSRLENTGFVPHELAKEIGLVGMAARACNLSRDVRCDYPFGMYRFKKVIIAKVPGGDVFARARVRHIEIKRSTGLLLELLQMVPNEKIHVQCDVPNCSSFAVSMVEGWRGETVHVARTDASGNLCQYKVIDPSFHNWTGLEFALRNGQISDFPLCNKSFNLSYAGYDL